MGSREDDDHWNTKYAEPSCHEHGEEPMYWDGGIDEWCCQECNEEDGYDDTEAANLEAYNYGRG